MKVSFSARLAMHASMVPRVMALAVVLVVSAWTRENISLRNQNPIKCPAHWPAHVCKLQALLPQSVSYENMYVVAHVATVVLWSLPPSCVTSSISLVTTSKGHTHTNTESTHTHMVH